MAVLREFGVFMGQTIKIAPFTGRDGYGNLTYGTDVVYRGRLVGKRRLVRNDQGEQVLSTQTIYLGSNVNVSTKDRVTLSTGDTGSTEPALLTPPILEVGRFPDDSRRFHHVAIFLG